MRLFACIVGLLVSIVAFAQAPPASLAGPERMQRLVEGAKAEGELMLYTSAPIEDITVLTDAFEKKYGVRTKLWRASSEKVLQRTLAEARSNRFEVDVVETNGVELEAMARERLLQPLHSPAHADLIPQAIPPHASWVGTRLVIFAAAYNTKLVRKDELPRRWEDLRDPKWKGRLGIEAEDADWFATVLADLGGEASGVGLFREIVRVNGVSVRKGHTLLTQLVVSGEVPLALTVYNYKAEQFKSKGAPIDWFFIGPAIARANGIGVMRRSKNPHAALLFHEFAISEEGQQLLVTRDFVPTHRNVKSSLNRAPLRLIDATLGLDDGGRWTRLFRATFGQSR